jgi:hypothetical protein
VIPIDQCVVRGVYVVDARNFHLGVFNIDHERPNFIGLRTKFDSTYLFGELHYDFDPHFGTCKPLKLVEMLPEGIEAICNVPSKYKDSDGVERDCFKTYEPLFRYLQTLNDRIPWQPPAPEDLA